MTRKEVYDRLESERAYQEHHWPGHKHEIPTYILMLEHYSTKAREAWNTGEANPLDIIRKLGGIVVACGEEHGLPWRAGFALNPQKDPGQNS